jgi:hypothetical protein
MTTTPDQRLPLCFVDCETTGTHPAREIWEVALIRRTFHPGMLPRWTEDMTTFMVTGVDLSQADPFGLSVGRFYDRHPQYTPGGPPIDMVQTTGREAAQTIEQWTRGAVLVGVGVAFDEKCFDTLLRRHQLAPAWHYSLRDVKCIAVGYLSAILQRTGRASAVLAELLEAPSNSDALAEACGVAPVPEHLRHTALGDAIWARDWYDVMIREEQG